MVHVNSLRSYYDGLPKLQGRRIEIFNLFLNENRPMTDREVKYLLKRQDMNEVRPSITWLIKNGYLVEFDQVQCPATGKHVRRCAPRPVM